MKEYLPTLDSVQIMFSAVLGSEGIMTAMVSHIRLKPTEAMDQYIGLLEASRAHRYRLPGSADSSEEDPRV